MNGNVCGAPDVQHGVRTLLTHRFVPFAATLVLVAGIAAVTFQVLNRSADTIDHTQDSALATLVRDANVPDLPFDDNPDPKQCGIPVNWGISGPAWVTGVYQGELIQPSVFLYDSHQRFSITGSVPNGTEVQVVLFQENPVLDFYFVKTAGPDAEEGWLPAPFLSFEPITPGAA